MCYLTAVNFSKSRLPERIRRHAELLLALSGNMRQLLVPQAICHLLAAVPASQANIRLTHPDISQPFGECHCASAAEESFERARWNTALCPQIARTELH